MSNFKPLSTTNKGMLMLKHKNSEQVVFINKKDAKYYFASSENHTWYATRCTWITDNGGNAEITVLKPLENVIEL
jgi:hypothetical protein